MNHQSLTAFCLAAFLLTVGCSTTAGVGEDLQSAGKAITQSSEDSKK